MSRKNRLLVGTLALLIITFSINAQQVVNPTKISKAVYFDKIESFKKLPVGKLERGKIERNAKLKERLYPNKGNIPVLKEDPVWQKSHGKNKAQSKAPLLSFDGQNTSAMPSDCNGEIGPNHFFQGVNSTLAIYDKSGALVAGPTDYNTLFDGVTGATRNDGDPIILYDSEAGRWLAAEFSLGSTKYMLIAVSETNDPTGAWYRWSFEMNGTPDYMKFGVWQDGYYMATNTEFGDDIYVFERDVMITGGASPQMIQFDNPNRPLTGFFTLQPLDNDGAFAPGGTPGQFITINDNAWGGTDDELWIFECDVDWTTPTNSTFARTQQIQVSDFDSDFGSDWENIAQPETSQELDAIPQILMYKVQYRNFGSSQSIVCVHAVDVDNSDHAGLRWYELENTGSGWSVRQEGTYAPDEHSRWLASIAMNGKHEIAIGYSISSSTEYPGIRYVGQSADENSIASGILDFPETNVHTGTKSQTGAERWGDYSLLSVDPQDDHTFWFTTEYVGATTTKSSKIIGFEFSDYNYPTSFSATAVSQSQINLLWQQNDANDDVLIAYSEDGTFGTPVNGNTYSANDAIAGGGTVLYVGSAESYNHTSLATKTTYYYKAWSLINATPDYSDAVYTSTKTLSPAPTNHVTNFTAATPEKDTVSLSWLDVSTGILPLGYIIKVSDVDYSAIADPVNGVEEPNDFDFSDGTGSVEVAQGQEAYDFAGFGVLTTYYFKIYPFTNSGTSILYKIDETVPVAEATTSLFYCSSTYSDTGDDWITNVSINTINNTTGQEGEDSYGDYTHLSTDLKIGSSYELSVSFSSSGYTEHVMAWIDWNRNGSFDNLSELYDLGDGIDATLTTNITVPEGAYVGEIRMRVIEEYNEDPSPCGSDEYGETEDYTLNIMPACTPPLTQVSNFSLDETTHNSLEISWTSGSQEVLVITSEGVSIDIAPSNGTAYIANSAFATIGTEFEEGYAVFSGVGENVVVTDLQEITDYYFTLYTYNVADNCYNKISPLNGQGSTYGKAVVNTGSISNRTSNTATVAGEVTVDNGLEVTEKGIVYATTTAPTIEDNKVVATETGLGSFSVQLSSLNSSTDYFVKAYAINSAGVSYGEQATFTTDDATGIEVLGDKMIKVYPNPNGGNFKLSILPESKSAELELTDANGNIVLKKTLNSIDTDIDITNEANGIYFLKIRNKGQSYSKKIIKK
jgi:hypothetical protein